MASRAFVTAVEGGGVAGGRRLCGAASERIANQPLAAMATISRVICSLFSIGLQKDKVILSARCGYWQMSTRSGGLEQTKLRPLKRTARTIPILEQTPSGWQQYT